ncbi:hypothetical protein [Thiorhodovibrio frisius]|uniref:Uncharacterized protein n=1 Tax=Thiorhodovibrio frisius TaxID=631362 RepID=H8YY00_9GAMM|nr:hypothetical protein [Thiorhodovibrio frisius]EIC23326.1 hypothetical protein Thi970DRAFT_00986 [Thiorhodovibrio frisius]WPL23594.1 hypothetical protein Thiofri_03786 [Thiorhodovibrio frisius]
MPSFIGISLTLIGAFFLFQALKTRGIALKLHAARENADQSSEEAPQSSEGAQSDEDAQSGEDGLSEQELFIAARRRRGQEIQSVASGCAPVAAAGFFLLALAVGAIAMVAKGPGRLSLFDALSIPFFAGMFLMKTYYSSLLAQAESTPEAAPTDSKGDSQNES